MLLSDIMLQKGEGERKITFENIERYAGKSRLIFMKEVDGMMDICMICGASVNEVLVETLQREKIYVKIKNIDSIIFLGEASIFQEIKKRQKTINRFRSSWLDVCNAADRLRDVLNKEV